METRQQHLEWCKQRAIEYVDVGDLTSALASFTSDIGKHPETQKSADIATGLGMRLLMGGHLSTPQQMREFINGFN